MAAPVLEARGLWLRYPGQRRWTLRDAALALHAGEVVSVLGPNGAGKTTLLKAAAGLLRPQRGEVLVEGRSLWDAPPGERLVLRRRVVYVSEKPVLVRGTVLDNIALGLRLRGAPREEAEEAARRAAERLGVAELLGEKASGLSRGQQQLVALARALALSPRALLLDEPFAHLDVSRRRLLARVIAEEASRGAAVAVATHDTYLASRLASRHVVVEEGATRAAKTLEEALGLL